MLSIPPELCHCGEMSSPHVTARELARREITRSITDVARAHLAEQGAAALSLRAVARDVGMVSSAVYRYFPSRDDLLTALIVDAYDAIGEVAERAHLKAVRAGVDHGMRWLSVCRAVRSWAKRHTQEWALVYGSPVVGYAAPTETIAPAARIAQVFVTITVDAAADGALVAPSVSVISRRQASADLVTLLEVDGELAFD